MKTIDLGDVDVDGDDLDKILASIEKGEKQSSQPSSHPELAPKVVTYEDQESLLDIPQKKWDVLLKAMDNPLEEQKQIAVKMKLYIDAQMKRDLVEYGKFTETTRKWLSDYNTLLSAMHKNIHGDKTTHEIKLTHGMIASKIRESLNYTPSKDSIVDVDVEEESED